MGLISCLACPLTPWLWTVQGGVGQTTSCLYDNRLHTALGGGIASKRTILFSVQHISCRLCGTAGRRHHRAGRQYRECIVLYVGPYLHLAVAVCAERSTLLRIKLDTGWRGQRILAMAVSSDIPNAPCTPCGVCRQAMREFCEMSMPVYFPTGQWRPGEQVLSLTLEQLLPSSFGPEALC